MTFSANGHHLLACFYRPTPDKAQRRTSIEQDASRAAAETLTYVG